MTSCDILSEKLKKIIVINNFKFRFHTKLANNVDRFRCCVNFCKSYIKVGDSGEILLYPRQHDHDSYTDAELARHEVSNAVTRKAMDDICEKPSKIICDHISENGDFGT